MKNLTILTITTLLIVCCTYKLQAQDNIVKVGLIGLAYKNINLKYERAINEKSSMNLNIQYKIPRGLPFGFDIEDIAPEINTDNEISIKGFGIAPEYRIYTSKKALKGFYLAPYIQYKNFNAEFDGEVDGYYGTLKTTYNNFGIGFQLGAQWLIKQRVSIDWYFLGLGANRSNLKMRLTSNDTNIDFKEYEKDAEGILQDIPFLEDKVESSSGSNYGEVKAGLIFPALRGGLSIGVAF